MLRCLFWNQYGNDVTAVVAEAAKACRLDILLFCEVGAQWNETLKALNRHDAFHFSTGRIYDRFHVYTRFESNYISIRSEAERYIVFEVRLPACDPFLLMILHGPSKAAGWTPPASALEAARYVAALRAVEVESGITKSVVVGDFNMNPFEPGIIGGAAFNAVMDARLTQKKARTIQSISYRYFYNPMWNLYGDATPGPPASHFFSQATHEELHWHMLDQLLVSPEMVDYIDVSAIRILDSIGDHRLVTREGRPAKKTYSDHLPLYFELHV